jgi:hypothetical protein
MIERCRRDTETMCDLGDADVGIGQQRFGSLDVIVGEFSAADLRCGQAHGRRRGPLRSAGN